MCLFFYHIFQTYYSNLNTEKDISTGLVGPLIICSKGIKADSDFKHTIIFFGEVDETQSWYFRKNVEKQYGRNSDLDLDDPDLVNNNRIQGVFDFLFLFYLLVWFGCYLWNSFCFVLQYVNTTMVNVLVSESRNLYLRSPLRSLKD